MPSNKPKGRKLHRRGPSVFHRNTRRKAILKNIGLTFLALLIIPAGFFAAKFMIEDSPKNPVEHSSAVDTGSTTQTTKVTTPAKTNPGKGDAVASGSMRAFYLPVKKMNPPEALDTILDNASAAGFNAVLFDLKGEDGVLRYKSETELAKQARSIDDGALTKQELKDLLQKLESKGFAAVPRLFAFRDPFAPIHISSAKITLEKYPTYTWLDNSREKGGKPWLNPYAPDAHSYIIGLAEELKDVGFSAILLDGVQFPNQTSQAGYGNSALRSLSKLEVLKKFVGDLKTAVGNGCRVIQSMPGLSAFKDGTEPFGGNPVTFGAQTVAPVLMPSTLGSKLKVGETTLKNPASNPYEAVKLAAGQVVLRLKLMEKQPDMMPWLQAYDNNAQQINEQIKAVKETIGNGASFILYHPNGSYDFGSINMK